MRIGKYILALFAVISAVAGLTAVYAQSGAPQSNPVALLQYVADNMISGLKTNKASLKTKPSVVYNLAYKYVVPYADVPEMAKRVIPPSVWNSSTPAQRMKFQKEFTRTLIRTYASALSAYEDQAIQFFPVRGGYAGAKTVVVNSEITSSSRDTVRVSYRLLRIGSVWRLYDMSVEGVDMLESFRSQFADILSQGNMDKLIARMSSHNNR